jgi:ribosomal protein S27AE
VTPYRPDEHIYWYLGDKFLGVGRASVIYRLRFDEAYFCPHCGDIWLRRVRLDGRSPRRWEVRSRPCERCGGGSALYVHEALSPSASELIKEMPTALLIREFLLRLNGNINHYPEVV